MIRKIKGIFLILLIFLIIILTLQFNVIKNKNIEIVKLNYTVTEQQNVIQTQNQTLINKMNMNSNLQKELTVATETLSGVILNKTKVIEYWQSLYYNLNQSYNKLFVQYETVLAEKVMLNNHLKNSDKVVVLSQYDYVKEFIRNDRTYLNRYDINSYNCQDFSQDMIRNARKYNMLSCVVTVTFGDAAHQIVSFNTIDNGVVYVEPQTNKMFYSLELGKNFCDYVNWNCDWNITKITDCW
jgi:hypothetical protein